MVMITLASYINKENGKEYKATIVPKVLVKTVVQEMHGHFGHYLLGTWESYSPTARQPNICKIVQSSLYSWTMYINKNKVLPPYVNSLATRWHITGNSTSSFSIQPYCIPAFLATAVFYLLISHLLLDINQLFLLDCVGLYL